MLLGTGTPILFRSAQQEPAGDAELASALATAYSRPLGAQVKEATITWPYTNFGKPSAIVSQTKDAALGVTTVQFANGTRLLVKPTNYEKNKIHVAISFGQGRAGVSPTLAHALWEAQLFPLAGTSKLSVGDIQKWAQTTGKVTSVNLEAGVRSFVLKGDTRPADLLSQMQLLAAYARDPGFRPEAAEKAKSYAPMYSGQLETNAEAVYFRGAQALMVGGDRRFENLPTSSDLARVEAIDLPRLLTAPLNGEADVVIVGDVTIADAIKAVHATFAAGPARKAVTAQAPHIIIRQSKGPAVFEHKGRADQARWRRVFSPAGLFSLIQRLPRRPKSPYRSYRPDWSIPSVKSSALPIHRSYTPTARWNFEVRVISLPRSRLRKRTLRRSTRF